LAGLAALPESGNFFEMAWRSQPVAVEVGRENFWPNFEVRKASSGLQLKACLRIVVIVNGGTHLWISLVYSTRSGVYAPHKPVGCSCMCLVEKMDKNSRCAKRRVFAQSVPVDMQKLIHNA
jgi:hypothetical protein